MATKSANLADVEFIAERLRWWLGLTPQEIIAHIKEHRMDALYTIPNPTGGVLVIGREAAGRFSDIGWRFLASQPAKKARVSLREFVEKLRSEFSRRFLGDKCPIDQSNIDRMISTAYRAAEREFETAVHYIPCALLFTNSVKSFAVGPVEFVHASEFFAKHQAEFDGLPAKIAELRRAYSEEMAKKGYPKESIETPEQALEYGSLLVKEMTEWFREFNWVAIVAIPNCEAEISYARALFLTKGALNTVKLILGPEYTDRLRTAEDHGHAVNTATLKRVDDELKISLSSTPKDNVAGDNWLDVLRGRSGHFLDQAARVLSLSAGMDTPPPLCVRFLDALHWYGDAVAERSLAAKIVKFVSAIERIVGTGPERNDKGEEIRGVTEIVTVRAAIFNSQGFEKPFEESKREIARIYDSRSDLVHGSISPFDESVAASVVKTQEATRMILLVALDFFNYIGLDNVAWSDKELLRRYQEVERRYLAAREQKAEQDDKSQATPS